MKDLSIIYTDVPASISLYRALTFGDSFHLFESENNFKRILLAYFLINSDVFMASESLQSLLSSVGLSLVAVAAYKEFRLWQGYQKIEHNFLIALKQENIDLDFFDATSYAKYEEEIQMLKESKKKQITYLLVGDRPHLHILRETLTKQKTRYLELLEEEDVYRDEFAQNLCRRYKNYNF